MRCASICSGLREAACRSSASAAAGEATRRGGQRRYSPASGAMLAVADTGPLYASLDLDDDDHKISAAALQSPDTQLVIPALVVAEVSYLAATRLGADAEAAFVAGLADLDVEAPLPQEWARIAELIRRYASFPLGTTDASVIALAERLETPHVITLDRRHFHAVRPAHCDAFELLPA